MSRGEWCFARRSRDPRPASAVALVLAFGAALWMTPRPAAAAERVASSRPATEGAASSRAEVMRERPEHDSAPPADEPVIELASGLVLRAGERLEIRWSVPATSVDELEILLSIDGGRRFPLRVSPELDARAGRYLWRVPNLSSAEARMRLRYHRDGREIDGAPSAPFTLIASQESGRPGSVALEGESDTHAGKRDDVRADEPDRAAERERPPVHEGTWWSGVGALDVPLSTETLASPEERIAASRNLPAAGPPPAAPSPARRVAAPRIRPSVSAQARASSPPVTPERHYPLRN